LTFFYFQN